MGMRFYDFEDWLDDQLDKVPWRWIFGPLLVAGLGAKAIEWLVWHGY